VSVSTAIIKRAVVTVMTPDSPVVSLAPARQLISKRTRFEAAGRAGLGPTWQRVAAAGLDIGALRAFGHVPFVRAIARGRTGLRRLLRWCEAHRQPEAVAELAELVEQWLTVLDALRHHDRQAIVQAAKLLVADLDGRTAHEASVVDTPPRRVRTRSCPVGSHAPPRRCDRMSSRREPVAA
jgi:hypothetical protein